MTRLLEKDHMAVAVAVPAAGGLLILAVGLFLLPSHLEVSDAARRAMPAIALPVIAQPNVALATRLPELGELSPTVLHADAAALSVLTNQLAAAGRSITTGQVARDLAAAGRPAVALEYLALRPDGGDPATWRLRFELLRAVGRTADAVALLQKAIRGDPRGYVPADIIQAGYAADRPDLIVEAAATGVIPAPDVALTLDLVRRAERLGRPDLIARLDQVTSADWRRADPWLALRLAERSGEEAAALKAVSLLPDNQQGAAREAIFRRSANLPALRALLLARATMSGVAIEPLAEQLLALGYRADAVALWKRAVGDGPPHSVPAKRLLYLLGPRPRAADVAWLRDRVRTGSNDQQLRWLAVYAESDRAAQALDVLAQHPLANHTEIAMLRLRSAAAAGNGGAGRDALAVLLDGRRLDADQIRAISIAVPRQVDSAMTTALAQLRFATGISAPRDLIDLAWIAWNVGDAKTTARWARAHLQTAPNDVAGLRLMADAQRRIGGAGAARPWLERALAETPTGTRDYAELLDRLGRRDAAITAAETLRRNAPDDRSVAALHARLLIADGRAGAAQKALWGR